jgi:uncharacterized protein (DUF1330 family)
MFAVQKIHHFIQVSALTLQIKESGGKYLAGGFNKTVTFDGASPPNRVVILQFESMDAAKAWDASRAQKESRKIGDKYATFRTFAVEGTEMK